MVVCSAASIPDRTTAILGEGADPFPAMRDALRRLEAMVVVVDAKNTLLVSGTGDVIQPSDGILGIGSGGNYALAAARALMAHSELSAADVVRRSLEIAGDICVYTNRNIVIEELS